MRVLRSLKAGLKPLLLFVALMLTALVIMAETVEQIGRTPREAAVMLERCCQDSDYLAGVSGLIASQMRKVDGTISVIYPLPALKLGMQSVAGNLSVASSISARRMLTASSSAQAKILIEQAQAGDVITFLPGTYTFTGQNLFASAQGRPDLPVVVRAQVPGSVKIEFASREGFRVSGAYWLFENLHIRGVCLAHTDCDHAFHVVGKARNFIARNNTIFDFNAHFKVNMEDGQAPDDGVLEYNTISNSSIRHTGHPVTTVDIVAVNGWRIHHNLVSDFIKENSDKISYGIFVKGGGERNRIDHNIVICEHALVRQAGQRVGISLGGGGTGAQYCRDQACVTEQNEGRIDSNLVLSCSDDGIYLNLAARSQVSHNTLLATGGISLRFAKTDAMVTNNLVDGRIRLREGAAMQASANLETSLSSLFLGIHPLRSVFQDPQSMDLRWSKKPKATPRSAEVSADLCGQYRTVATSPGAFEDFTQCLHDPLPVKATPPAK